MYIFVLRIYYLKEYTLPVRVALWLQNSCRQWFSSLVRLHHDTSHKRTTFFRHTSNRSGSIFLVGQGVDNSTHRGKIYRSNSSSSTSSSFFFIYTPLCARPRGVENYYSVTPPRACSCVCVCSIVFRVRPDKREKKHTQINNSLTTRTKKA